MDIEHSTTLDTLTTKLAAISGEGELGSHPTPDDNYYYPSTAYNINCGRKTPGSAGSIASIPKSLERIESRISDWIGPQESGYDLHESRSRSGGRIDSNRISYFPEHYEVSMSSGGAYTRCSKRGKKSYNCPTGPTSWSDWEWSEEHQCSTCYRQDSEGVYFCPLTQIICDPCLCRTQCVCLHVPSDIPYPVSIHTSLAPVYRNIF